MKPRKPQQLRSLRERGLAEEGRRGLRLTEKGREALEEKLGIGIGSIARAWSQRLRGKPEEERKWLRAYCHILPVLEKRLGSLEGKKILEIGYGKPWFMEILREAGAEVAGLDPALRHEGSFRVVKDGVENLDKHFEGEQFDAVVVKNVLTSFILASPVARYILYGREIPAEKRRRILTLIREKLRPGGVLVVQDIDAPVKVFPVEDFKACGFSVFVREDSNIYSRLVIAMKTGK